MLRKTILLLIFFLSAIFPSPSYAATPYNDGNFVVAEATGQGRTIREARINARQNATQQALGFIVKGSSSYREDSQGKKLREAVLQISRGSISDERELSHSEENGRHRVTLQVKIRGDLLRGLLREDFSESAIDGLSLVSRAQRREQWEKEVSDTLLEVIGTFPVSQYIKVDVSVGEDAFSSGTEKLSMNVRFAFDRAGYFSDAVPNLTAILDYVADSVIRDIPFSLPSEPERRNKEKVTVVTPPQSITNIYQYLKLMRIEKQNRYIDTERGGFANIYILTSDYYFNAYRITPNAFIRLVEGLFVEKSGRLTGCAVTKAELNIDFLTAQKQNKYKYTAPMGLQAVMFFLNVIPLGQKAWNLKNHGPLDESRHALFIFPVVGVLQNRDYQLIEKEENQITISLPREKLMDVSTTASYIKVENNMGIF